MCTLVVTQYIYVHWYTQFIHTIHSHNSFKKCTYMYCANVHICIEITQYIYVHGTNVHTIETFFKKMYIYVLCQCTYMYCVIF